jgi:hypothetical protein
MKVVFIASKNSENPKRLTKTCNQVKRKTKISLSNLPFFFFPFFVFAFFPFIFFFKYHSNLSPPA